MFGTVKLWKALMGQRTVAKPINRRKPISRRLVLEPLEDRVVPSTVTIAAIGNGSEAVEYDHTSPATFRVTRDSSVGSTFVNYSVDTEISTAIEGTDFESLTGVVEITNGNYFAEFLITPIPDSDIEGTESVKIILTSADDYPGGCCCSSSSATIPSPGTATITIADDDSNHAPVGTSNTVETDEDTPYVFVAADFGFTDPNDDPAHNLYAVQIVSLPSNGVLTLDDVEVEADDFISASDIGNGYLVFTPAENANGTAYASFTFKVQDDGTTVNGGADLDTTARTMTIDVTAVNDAPVNTTPEDQETAEGTAVVFSTGNSTLISITDADGGSFSLKVTLAATDGTLTLSGMSGLTFLTGNGTANATMTFTGTTANINSALDGLIFAPTPNHFGTAYVQITTNDLGNIGPGGALIVSNAVAITVTSVNNAPLGADNTITIVKNGSHTFAAADFGFLDPGDFGADTFNAVKIATLPGAGALKLDGVNVSANDFISIADIGNSLLVFTPATDATGISYASFTFQVEDDGGTCDGGQNLDPTANTITLNVYEAESLPDANAAPVNTVPGLQSTKMNTDLVFSSTNENGLSIADSDAGSSELQVTLIATHGTLSLSGTTGLTFASGDGTDDSTMTFVGIISAINAAFNGLTFKPEANFHGGASVELLCNDQGNAGDCGAQSDGDTVDITVNTVAADIEYNVAMNQTFYASTGVGVLTDLYVSWNHLFSVTFVTVDSINYSAGTPITFSSGGQLTVQSDGSLTYIPYADFIGMDTFTVTAVYGAETATETIKMVVDDSDLSNSEYYFSYTNCGVMDYTSTAEGMASTTTLSTVPFEVDAVSQSIIFGVFYVRLEHVLSEMTVTLGDNSTSMISSDINNFTFFGGMELALQIRRVRFALRNVVNNVQIEKDAQNETLPEDISRWFCPNADMSSADVLARVLTVYQSVVTSLEAGTTYYYDDPTFPDDYGESPSTNGPANIGICGLYHTGSDRERFATVLHELTHVSINTADSGYHNLEAFDNAGIVWTYADVVRQLTTAQLLNNADTFAGYFGQYYYNQS